MKKTLKKSHLKGTVNSFYELMRACQCETCFCVYCSCSSNNIADYDLSYFSGTKFFNYEKTNG